MGMGVDVRMNYAQMEEAAAAYGQVASDLADLYDKMGKLAAQMEQGALLGEAGSDFKAAITEVLQRKIQLLGIKMNELENDLKGAVSKMRDGVDTATSRFH
jgi:uncharacterized protein YukE